MTRVEDQVREAVAEVRAPMPSAQQLIERGRSRRARARIMKAGVAVVVIAGCATVAYQVSQHAPESVTADAPGTAPTSAPPDVVGLTLAQARERIAQAGLRSGLYERDPDIDAAIVIAQEPSASNPPIANGDVVGLRSALPDPPADLECGPQHPHDDAVADALPRLDALTRTAAEQAVIALQSDRSEPVYLAQWNRWAVERVAGDAQVVPTRGYQVVIVADGSDCEPVEPSYYNGVPVTYVKGPLSAFAAALEVGDPFEGQCQVETDVVLSPEDLRFRCE